jgi:cation:H+ antiporter
VLGVRLIHTNRDTGEKDSGNPDEKASENKASGGLRKPVIGFVAAAAVILIAAPFLARSAATLAEEWGIASGFFGMVFLAAATSLPEVAVVWAALKAGAYTLAVGNLFGSNCFNMVVFLVLDVVDGGGPLLATAEPGVIVGALFAIVLTGQALLDLLNRSEHRVWFVEPGPALLVLTYAAGLFLSYGATQ